MTELQQSNGQGEVDDVSGGYEENQVVPEERQVTDEPKSHVDSEPNNPEKDIIDLAGDSDDDQSAERQQEPLASNEKNIAPVDQMTSDGRQTACNESQLGNSYAR